MDRGHGPADAALLRSLLLWFAGLWVASVLGLGVVAFLLRSVLL